MNIFPLVPPPEFFCAPLCERREFYWWVVEEVKVLMDFSALSPCEQERLLGKLYEEGRLFGLIDTDFREFKNKATVRKRHSIPGAWYYRHGVDFREPLKYRRRAHHRPKDLSPEEVARRDWRLHKGFSRNRRRHFYGERKKVAKRISNRSYRAWAKSLLRTQAYDRLSSRPPKNFFDPWFWD